MKKTFLIFLFSLFGTCFAFENNSAQFPQAQFQSVNTCRTVTGNYEPKITPVGGTAPYTPSRPRKVGSDPTIPFPDPIGDYPIELVFTFVIVYIAMVRICSQRCKQSESASTNG